MVNTEHIILQAHNETSSVTEKIELASFKGQPFTLAFNNKYVLEAVKAMKVDVVSIYVSQNLQKIVFISDEKKGSLQLIMATRTTR